MLAHLYGFDLHSKNRRFQERSKSTDVICEKDVDVEDIQYQVRLYIVASMYLVPTLCTKITNDIGPMLEAVLRTDGYPSSLRDVAKYIYVTHADAAADLRGPLVAIVAKHLAEWASEEDFEQLFLDVPQLGVELIRFVVEGAVVIKVATSQTAASGRSKRKR